jgi:hypothetical protein
MTISTDNDILEYLPDLHDYGITDFSDEHIKTRTDILRKLRVDWYPKVIGSSTEMDETLLTDSQFTRAAVFHVLSYYILPKLTQFTTEGDRFERMMEFYKLRYDEEMDLVIRDGVEYDINDDGSVTDSEKPPLNTLRLER